MYIYNLPRGTSGCLPGREYIILSHISSTHHSQTPAFPSPFFLFECLIKSKASGGLGPICLYLLRVNKDALCLSDTLEWFHYSGKRCEHSIPFLPQQIRWGSYTAAVVISDWRELPNMLNSFNLIYRRVCPLTKNVQALFRPCPISGSMSGDQRRSHSCRIYC